MRVTAYRMSWQVMAGLGGAIMASVSLGAIVANGAAITMGVLAAVLVACIAASLLGRLIFPIALIVAVPLIPVAGDPPIAGASNVRLGVMAIFLAGGFLIHTQSRQRLQSAGVSSLVTAFLILAAFGTLVAIANGTDSQDILKTLSLMTGQPLVYAGFLGLFAITVQSNDRSRTQLLCAWAVVMIVEGLYVAGQFATGSAYDAVRGFSRGQGTTGADFLGAFAAISFFGALALRAVARSTRVRLLAWAAMCAAVGSQLASTSRGSLVGLGLGLVYLLFRRHRSSLAKSRQNIALVLSLAIILGGGLYATKGLWLSRLNARSTASFDRPATWVSGLRIARDHLFTGVGPTKIATLIQNDPRYSSTQYGGTTSVPHDMWIFALAAGGLPYGLAAVWVTFVLFRIVRQASAGRLSREGLYLEAALIAALPVFVINNVFTHPEVMIAVMLATALAVVPTDNRCSRQRMSVDNWKGSSHAPVSA
jgi:hypothetical protein